MERTRKERKLLWKNTGGGNLYLGDKRVIKSGETFEAFSHQVSKAFRRTIKLLTPVEPEVPVVPKPVVFTMVARGGNWYNILDSTGKTVNTKPLRRKEAEAHLALLQGGG